MPTVLLVRHAQASFGSADYDVLSEVGQRQVDALAARGIDAARVVTGSLRRQRDTARGWSASVDPRWNEYDYADVLSHHSTTPARVEHEPGVEDRLSSREFQVLLDAALREWVLAGEDSPCARPGPRSCSA